MPKAIWNGAVITEAAGGAVNRDAAWYYPQPNDAAKQIAGHIAFWRGVQIEP